MRERWIYDERTESVKLIKELEPSDLYKINLAFLTNGLITFQGQIKRSRYISRETRQAIWDRDEGRCQVCGGTTDLEFDHIIPWAKGGSNSPNNIQILCLSCNREKRDKI